MPNRYSGRAAEISTTGLQSRAWRDAGEQAGKCTRCHKREPVPPRKTCDICTQKHNEENRRENQQLKDAAFAAYGGYTCNCCNESHTHEFMTIDHIAGDGHAHKDKDGYRLKGKALYRWLKHHNYPAGFQALCANCNHAKQNNEQCPHVAQRQELFKKLAALPLTY